LFYDSGLISVSEAYENRKRLENDDFRVHLQKWIQKIWPEVGNLPLRRQYQDFPTDVNIRKIGFSDPIAVVHQTCQHAFQVSMASHSNPLKIYIDKKSRNSIINSHRFKSASHA
jgi:hypothetical protein